MPGDPSVRVLDVVDGVLLAPLRRQVDVDLDRLVGAARDEVPARRVDPHLVEELVEEDDVAAALRHLRRLAASGQVDELVDQHLDAVGVVAEHPRDGRVPVARAVVVGAEDVDRPVEAAVELVGEVDDVGGPVGRKLRPPSESARGRRRRRARTSGPRPHRPSRTCPDAAGTRRDASRTRSASPTSRSGSGSAPASPRSGAASAGPDRPATRASSAT